jgi:hypothetical protein
VVSFVAAWGGRQAAAPIRQHGAAAAAEVAFARDYYFAPLLFFTFLYKLGMAISTFYPRAHG